LKPGLRDEALLALLEPGRRPLVFTRTRRLARALRLRVAELRGEGVAVTPPIHTFDAWLLENGPKVLAAEHAGGAAGRLLLTRAAEQLLWERVIVANPGKLPRELLDASALAATAAEAWRRVRVWERPGNDEFVTEDVDAFRAWLPKFEEQLEKGGFVTAADLSRLVETAIIAASPAIEIPSDLLVAGFERWDPAIRRVVDAFIARGAKLHEDADPLSRTPAPIHLWTATTTGGELREVALRIRRLLREAPDLRIGVLAPAVAPFAARLERIFEEELDPVGTSGDGNRAVRCFDLSTAPTLDSYPLIADAIDLLSLPSRRVPFALVSRVLLSGRLCGSARGAELERQRANMGAVEARLRRRRAAVLSLNDLGDVLRQAGIKGAPDRLARLTSRLEEKAAPKRSPSQWRSEWIKRLEILEWTSTVDGEVEGLAFKHWRDAVDELAMLETVETSMSADEALARLRAICGAMQVQPASTGLGVQVLDLLDATGLEFDVVFAIAMTSSAFPAPPRPNPLLPVRWQRRQEGMPRVSVESERELAGIVWERVVRSAREVHASYAVLGDGDEEQMPSAHLDRSGEHPPAAPQPWWLEAWDDAQREPRPADVAGAARVRRGSATLFAHQSDCPFRAFASRRLGAEALAAMQPQPDRARRGELVHDALKHAYGEIESKTDLDGLSDGNIDEHAQRAAAAAIDANTEFFADALHLKASAQGWLSALVASWMRYEKGARTAAWTVESLESSFTERFPPGVADPLTISFRTDRIDAVDGDGILVLDYKTSPKSASVWRGERPEQPQLPLYQVLLSILGRRVEGIAFANVAARDRCELTGLSTQRLADKLPAPSAKIDYATGSRDWQAALDALARDYLAGVTAPDPRKPSVCKQCRADALCRIRETAGADADEAEGDE
jgi:probable DNA repair protein